VSARATIVTYHAIEPGPAPLFLDPELFARHLDVLDSAGCTLLTVSELARGLRAGALPQRAVALTFDDAYASVVSRAVPSLLARGWRATVFCVAGHVDGFNDWASQPPAVPRRPLASASGVAWMAAQGLEIASHTMTHASLDGGSHDTLRYELLASRERLEAITGTPVEALACPYGRRPGAEVRAAIEATYDLACSTRPGLVTEASDCFALPRVDAHYLRRPELLRRVVCGGGSAYIAARSLGARVRRTLISDARRR
jgi:peptidoglycan/xylan/chitin deacetylase (PgdA/CDA1 family)